MVRRPLVLVASAVLLVAVGLVVRNQYKVWRQHAADAAERARIAAYERLPVPEALLQSRKRLLAELQPVTLENCQLARFGGVNDGGYLMCINLLDGIETAYSYGIGTEDAWGCSVSLAFRVPVHEYDCFSPTKVQCDGGKLHLNPECVGPKTETQGGRPFDTLANQIARNKDTGKRIVVKMDVEGAEWESILATPAAVLDGIEQLAMELHGIDEPRVVEGLKKLKTHFHLLSVHFNNNACSQRARPFPSSAYQVLFVNKRLGRVGPPIPGSPTPESLMAPDALHAPDCQLKK
jgi:hypothetical protein